jgi:single-strand DNA-binding protein
MNRCTLIGHLGADPETRTTNSGSVVCNLRLATNERRKDRDGNWGDHTEWHRIVAFGKTAENIGRHLAKGRQICVEGKISTRKWTDNQGADRYSTEVIADRVHFLGGRGEGGGSQGGGGGGHGGDRGRSSAGGGDGHVGGDLEDIPF